MSKLTFLSIFLFALYFIGYIEKCNGHYVETPQTQTRIRKGMYHLYRELVRDAIQKIRNCQYIREFFGRSPAFYVAQNIFNLRMRFARMMRLYTSAYDIFVKLKWNQWKFIIFARKMLEMQRILMDIDHLVEVLTEWEEVAHQKVVNIGGIEVSKRMIDLPDISQVPFFGLGGESSGPPRLSPFATAFLDKQKAMKGAGKTPLKGRREGDPYIPWFGGPIKPGNKSDLGYFIL